MAHAPGSLRAPVAAAGSARVDRAIDTVRARALDRHAGARHAVVATSRDLGVQVEFWGPGDGTDGWAADAHGGTETVAMLRAPGHPANGLVVTGSTVADAYERALVLLMSIRATGAFFAAHPSHLN